MRRDPGLIDEAVTGEGRRASRGKLPSFPVVLDAPDLSSALPGNTGVRGFWTFAASEPGPHTHIVALTHGNEIAGAIVLDGMLREGIRPRRGRLTLGFANIEAFARFDAERPTSSRYVDEDMNRVWCRQVLDGTRDSAELRRAREMRPLVDQADLLLDLHSMLWDSDPLLISGPTGKARRLAMAIGEPGLVIGDEGHAGGRRLIDYRPFVDPGTSRTAVLVEAGQHWQPDTVTVMRGAVSRLLVHTGQIDLEAAGVLAGKPLDRLRRPPVFAQVTRTITAATSDFAFVRAFRGGEIVARQNTLIALDGEAEIRTPHHDCLLVMPSLHTCRGQTAVRLARVESALTV